MLQWGQSQRTQCCDGICHAQGDAVAGAEILMVRKYCDAIFFLGTVESGMFCTDTRCNTSVVQLNWYIFDMNLWSWIFFPWSKVFERSGHCPSSDGNVPRGRSRAICIFRARHSCAICIIRARSEIIRARSVLFPTRNCVSFHVRSVRGPCVFDARRAHAVFVGPGFEPLTLQVNLCTGPRFDSRAWLPVSGQ